VLSKHDNSKSEWQTILTFAGGTAVAKLVITTCVWIALLCSFCGRLDVAHRTLTELEQYIRNCPLCGRVGLERLAPLASGATVRALPYVQAEKRTYGWTHKPIRPVKRASANYKRRGFMDRVVRDERRR
jgi:hypothetical protein